MSENTTPSLGELGQIAFVVSDLDRAVIFLRDQVGLKLLFQLPPGLAFFQCGSVFWGIGEQLSRLRRFWGQKEVKIGLDCLEHFF